MWGSFSSMIVSAVIIGPVVLIALFLAAAALWALMEGVFACYCVLKHPPECKVEKRSKVFRTQHKRRAHA
ncbi:MAG: hypothetical protein A2Z20_04480 [Bdellovibrionales bacterium RBG_16_40_8]|nr:MAG: hypothetical protein A2Z20_04480 [Bdellovibrionales bacterium RBG_16_40_8]